MQKTGVGKIVAVLAIMIMIFGCSHVFADMKGVSLNKARNASSNVLPCNNKNIYRVSASNGTTSPHKVETRLMGGSTSTHVGTVAKKFSLDIGDCKSFDVSASKYNYARVVLYGNSADNQKTGCIATGLVSNQ